MNGTRRYPLPQRLPCTPLRGGPHLLYPSEDPAPWRAGQEHTLTFDSFGLDSALLRAVSACGFTSPTPVQAQAIPAALEGRDLLASAQTGTGKTAAFVLPILQRLITHPGKPGKGPRALVLCPTRELAQQVSESVRTLSRFVRIRSGSIVGGMSYSPQYRLLDAPVDVLVATPGRLMDHMEQRRVDFSRLEVLVLDEADRMLDMGFAPAVQRIASATPTSRQTLLFSATLEGAVLGVAKRHQKSPVTVRLAPVQEPHTAIDQWIHEADGPAHKRALLDRLLGDPAVSQVIVFIATKRGAKRLAADLGAQGHRCAALHGNMTQAARRRTVEQLRGGRVQVLVATDVAARGLDVPGISHVINFELPMTPEDYIHRIGRTGRAGATGVAISLVGRPEIGKLRGIERLTGRRMVRRVLTGLEPVPDAPHAGGRREPAPGRRGFPGQRQRRFGGGRGQRRHNG
jgi:superfamily II DNA/RNA helicase